jgi:Zn-dependent M28 family amino/carboxypeptidase
VRQTAQELGYEEYFLREQGAIEDDHVPFLKLGVSAVNLIDFEYGPGNEYWHTEEDTMDKLSAKSLEVVGRVVLGVIKKLDAQD